MKEISFGKYERISKKEDTEVYVEVQNNSRWDEEECRVIGETKFKFYLIQGLFIYTVEKDWKGEQGYTYQAKRYDISCKEWLLKGAVLLEDMVVTGSQSFSYKSRPLKISVDFGKLFN